MPKFSMDDLDPKGRFLLIASMKVAIELEDNGFSKEKYITWCSEVWDTIKMHGDEDIEEILNGAMKDDLEIYLKRFKNG